MAPLIAQRILALDFRFGLWLLALAGVSDALDGYLARRFQWTTRSGLILDPVADKTLLAATYLALGAADALPWWLVILVLGRDLVLLAAAGVMLFFTRLKVFPPSVWGKISTVFQIATGLWALLEWVPELMIVLTAAVTAWSGLHYLIRGALAWWGFGGTESRIES